MPPVDENLQKIIEQDGPSGVTDRSLRNSDWDCINCDEFALRCFNNCDLGALADMWCSEKKH